MKSAEEKKRAKVLYAKLARNLADHVNHGAKPDLEAMEDYLVLSRNDSRQALHQSVCRIVATAGRPYHSDGRILGTKAYNLLRELIKNEIPPASWLETILVKKCSSYASKGSKELLAFLLVTGAISESKIKID